MLKSFSKFLPPTCVSTDKETKNYATEYNILKKLSVIELVQLEFLYRDFNEMWTGDVKLCSQ